MHGRSLRRFSTALACLGTLCSAAGCRSSKNDGDAPVATKQAATPTQTAPSAKKPKLVVLLVVDQLASWTFNRDRAHFTGGFKRLIDDGVLFPRVELPYANSFTAPGHATIGTGAPPAVTGVLSNSWYQRDEKRKMSAVADSQAMCVTMPGSSSQHHASAARLRVEGIGDALRKGTNNRGKAVAVTLKDRAGLFMLGKQPTAVYWYDSGQEGLVTTSVFHDALPDWVVRFNTETPPSKWFDRTWVPLDAKLLAKVTGIEDNGIGEGSSEALDTTFPHSLKDNPAPASGLRLSPMGTEYLFEAAKAALAGEDLGTDDVTDVLGISVSTHDYVGHYWGQESWERLDLLLRLDRTLGEFLTHLDNTVGAGNYAVVVTSDHGGTPMVERTAKKRPAYRVTRQTVAELANQAATNVLGEGQWIASCSAATVFVSDAFKARKPAEQEEALATIIEALLATDGLGYAALVKDIAGNCDKRNGIEQLACRSVHPELSGEIFVAPSDGSMLVGAGYRTGTAHGSPSDEDRHVPVIVAAPGGRRGVADEHAELTQVAPTVTELLGVAAPPAASAEPLRYHD